jgi:hypothetical protein
MITFVAMSFLIAGSGLVSAQQPTLRDGLLDAMTGTWILRGDIRSKPTTHDVEVAWVLNHQFLRIHEVSREKTRDGRPEYEAEVLLGWDAARRQYVAHWMDVFGGGFSVTGYGGGTAAAIPLIFGSESGAFHTTFAFDERSNSWQWTMDAEQEGTLRPFARLTMTKPGTGRTSKRE